MNNSNIDIVKNTAETIAETVRREDRIVAVYIFGSSLSGACKKTSDVDLAFLMDEPHYASDPVKVVSPAFMIATRIGMSLAKKTDVTILNNASLEIAYEVITTGRCVYENDQDRRLAYECKIRGLYFDFMPFIDKLRSENLERLLNQSGGS
ncbi:MAG: nucleotidyltransferase domain-containing protein [Desulfobacterales bacterium]|nr:nucleotidyltransferase domain-containing protein [Desulfobacterales bacterium]